MPAALLAQVFVDGFVFRLVRRGQPAAVSDSRAFHTLVNLLVKPEHDRRLFDENCLGRDVAALKYDDTCLVLGVELALS